MIRNDAFYMQEIEQIKYLLPVGQMRSDLRHGTVLNSTGEYIWNLLEEDLTREEIIDKCLRYFEASDAEKDEITADINNYLDFLVKNSLVLEDMKQSDYLNMVSQVVIANIKMNFYGDEAIYPENIKSFESLDRRMEDIRVELLNSSVAYVRDRKLLVDNELLKVVEGKDCYILTFPSSKEVLGCQISKDGRLAKIHAIHNLTEEGKILVFDTIRVVFLYMALHRGYVAIHSASILYNNKAWLFTASSGTGKSTHASLWKEVYDVDTINGDLNIVSDLEDIPKVYGTPWCGTSGIYDIKEHELGGVILLKRGSTNVVEELPIEKQILDVGQRVVSPPWNKTLTAMQYDILNSLIKKVKVASLTCTKDQEAAVVMKQYIDNIQ